MRIRRKSGNENVTPQDWNDLVDVVNKLSMITSGRGIVVKNLPGGITVSIDLDEIEGEVSGMRTELARVWTHGPHESPAGMASPTRPGGDQYWVREIDGGTLDIKEGGFWEPAWNLAEFGIPGTDYLPGGEAASLLHPIISCTDDPGEVEEYKYNVASASIEEQNWNSPVVPTWKILSHPYAEPPYRRVFFVWPFKFMSEELKQYGNPYADPPLEQFRTRLTHFLDVGVSGIKYLTPTVPPNGSWVSETPTGVIDGANDTFTLLYTPSASEIMLFKKMYMVKDTDYTVTAKTITYAAGQIPQVGDEHHCHYIKAGA